MNDNQCLLFSKIKGFSASEGFDNKKVEKYIQELYNFKKDEY